MGIVGNVAATVRRSAIQRPPAAMRRDQVRLRGEGEERHAPVARQPAVVLLIHVVCEASDPPAVDGGAQAVTRTRRVVLRRPARIEVRELDDPVRPAPRRLEHVVVIGWVVVDARADEDGLVHTFLVHLEQEPLDRAPVLWVGHGRVVRPCGPGVAMAIDDHRSGSSITLVITTTSSPASAGPRPRTRSARPSP